MYAIVLPSEGGATMLEVWALEPLTPGPLWVVSGALGHEHLKFEVAAVG